MYLSILIIVLTVTNVQAALNGACTVGSKPGVCVTTSSCSADGGTSTAGYCPNDPADVRCCTKSCGSGGTCRFTNTCSTGRTQTGLCPGPSTFTCCLPSTSCSAPAEGFVARPAPDPIGLPTVGYGHLCKTTGCAEVPYSFPLTTTTATALLTSDLATFRTCVTNYISKSVRLNANQYGALVSWAFNVGCGNVSSSSLIKRLNAGEAPNTVAGQELPKWNQAGGQVLPGLVNRRAAEVKLFQTATSTGALPAC
ncbi:lysozyme [Panaeolus papilionaceus]|nr:lysozyme [Panaeolus papilionaceus]